MNGMIKWIDRWSERDQKMFCVINRQWRRQRLDRFMQGITYFGGATFTLSCSIALILFLSPPWSAIGWKCLVAVFLTHLPVQCLKKVYPRQRPYRVLPHVFTCKNPLEDHSFPSGHTTAVFALTTPLWLSVPSLGLILIPLSICVGLSRIYLGLHYPSDVVCGALIGLLGACAVFIML
jgi:undecaprenyl-diphosphatase